MGEIDIHHTILYIMIGFSIISVIAVLIILISLKRLVKEMVEYHSTFADIHEELKDKIDSVIRRQAKLAGVIWNVASEGREHYRKVYKVFNELGVKFEEKDSGKELP